MGGGAVKAIVASRASTKERYCDCCERYRLCARVVVIIPGEPNKAWTGDVWLCSGCCRAGMEAAQKKKGEP